MLSRGHSLNGIQILCLSFFAIVLDYLFDILGQFLFLICCRLRVFLRNLRMTNQFSNFLSLVHFGLFGRFLLLYVFEVILTLMFLQFLLEIVLISFIFFVVIIEIGLFQLLDVAFLVLWEHIFEGLMIVLFVEVMMELLIIFLLFMLIIFFLMFIWVKLMPDSLNGMALPIFLPIRILRSIASLLGHVHHLRLIVGNLFLEFSFFLLFLSLLIEFLIILLLILCLLLLLL